jgi:hypothetical protein
MDSISTFAPMTTFKRGGIQVKAAFFPTGQQSSAINSPAWSDLQGVYFESLFRPFSLPNAGTKHLQGAMEKRAYYSAGDLPTFSTNRGWVQIL